MIIQLRRRHYRIWQVLALLLPLLVILAYFNIPESKTSSFQRQLEVFSAIAKSQKTAQLTLNLRVNTKQKYQLELIILKPIEGVANQIFVSNQSDKPQQICLGAIESTGTYRFLLPDSLSKQTIFVSIFDVIKQQERIKITIR